MTSHLDTGPSASVSPATDRIAHQILETMPRRSRRGNVLREEISAIVADCLALMSGAQRSSRSVRMPRLRPTVARWASIGVPIDIVQRHVHAGFRLHLDDLQARRAPFDDVRRLMDALSSVTATVSTIYLDVAPPTSDHGAYLAHTLLSGRYTTRTTREHGAPADERYTVLAVAATRCARDAVSPRDFRAMLSTEFGQPVPGLESGFGATILVPQSCAAAKIRDLVALTSLTVVGIAADRPRIPSAVEEAHELLDVATRLHYLPGMYQIEDLAIEYQLTRPGPGRDRLESFLDPVAEFPDLISTLRAHLGNGLNRRLTSRETHVHMNTVDYRLRRIYDLVGLSAHDPKLMWLLQAALVVRDYQSVGRSDNTGF
ncbi:PucR family transcriptional regulator [Nocardia alba]|uniref:PucR-like helix-turn-helix protein n=1 Tax=Nocardia alba TaxID=225051 RepID=A0A4R1FKA2_9NOCA|nr:helix-turn-helix domain-containing protein [Nocardia alba]TCJ93822.1 PucR-like helix-turn-helix protein [Nocardia alba]